MNKSLIWIVAGVAAVGFAVPAFAARGDSPEHINRAPLTVATVASTDDGVAHDVTDDNGVDITTANSVDDNGVENTTANSVDDNGVDDDGVEDVSGPCDEAEHATDPACTGVAVASTEDNSGHNGSDDNSGHGGGSDDSGHHGDGNENDG